MSSKEVEATCKVWGMISFESTLDFDPVLVYNEGMAVAEFRASLEPILTIMPSDGVLEDAILNVEKYRSVQKLLEEWER